MSEAEIIVYSQKVGGKGGDCFESAGHTNRKLQYL